jgi:1-aminocyclopropane-1-carboxylate deaminase/D-cysteine desulfhydrase-like pyridoxal-dependent ACC family enzyme|tara:strand:+ start:614 stop:1093 length:480 start_codon:yes stop_codon:yes gene_type:complete
MSQKYLCANHSQQLRNNPKQALKAWSKCYEAGQSMLAMGFHFEALAHLGCAFEAAEIVLSSEYFETYDATTILTSSAATLAKHLQAYGQIQESETIITLTIQRLEKECKKHPELTCLLKNQMISLKYFVGSSTQDEYPLEENNLSFLHMVNRPASTAIH